MTLVVARVAGDRIGIVADTLLTEHGRPLEASKGCIKTCLFAKLAVSFSNSPELALDDCTRFFWLFPNGADFSQTVSFFEQSSKKTGNEYLLAISQPAKLVKIVNGKRQDSISKTQWIGDKDAYEAFREYESKLRKQSHHGRAISSVLCADELEGSPASDLYSVMRNIVYDPNIKTVGGFVCTISNRDGQFRHSVYTDFLLDWPSFVGDNYAHRSEEKIDFGASGENIDFSVSQFCSAYLSVNYVGFYFLKGRTAFVFHPSDSHFADSCTVFRDIEPMSLKATLDEHFGKSLVWRIWIAAASHLRNETRRRVEPDPPENGASVSIMMHANTFPPTGTVEKLPDLEMWYNRPTFS